MEASYVVVRLLQHFQAIEAGGSDPEREFVERVGLSQASGVGTWVRMTRAGHARQSAA
jgi:hypothetical protein